jgi:hypothetical protein
MALALQRGVGNAAVARTLARAPAPQAPEKPAAPGFELPAGTGFQWLRDGMDFSVLLSKSWLLANGAAPDDKRVGDPRIIRPLVLGITSVAPWAVKADLEALIASGVHIDLDAPLKDKEEVFSSPLYDFSKRFVGNPPGEDLVVAVRKDSIIVFADRALILKHVPSPDATKIADEAFNTLVFNAIELKSGMTFGKHKPPAYRTEMYKDWEWYLGAPAKDGPKTELLELPDKDVLDMFGPQWGELQAKPTGDAVAGNVGGHPVIMPAELAKAHARVMKLMHDILGPGSAKPDPAAKPVYVSAEAVKLLEQIAKEKEPRRSELVARLRKPAGDLPGQVQSAEEWLSSVIAEQDSEEARKRLHMKEPKAAELHPVENRPVHGRIINHGARPIPRKPMTFTFVVDDDVDAFKAPWIDIKWSASRDGTVVGSEVTSYSPLKGDRIFNDKTFNVTFPAAGIYAIDAFVNHNFFRPAHFETDVQVLSESEEAKHLDEEALKGFALPGTEKSTDFDVGRITGALTDYEEGKVTTGRLDPGFKPGTTGDRLKVIDEEIARVEKLQQEFAGRAGPEGKQVQEWAKTYLKKLHEGERAVVADTLIEQRQHVPAQGVYVSRSKNVRSGQLSLLCLLSRTSAGYKVVLHDLTQLYEADNYRYEAEAAKPEDAYKKVFTEHATAYPDGTLAVTFTAWDEKTQAPGTTYVRYEKKTDTLGKDVKGVVFNEYVAVAVNLASLVLTVFPPTTALGITLAVAYNGAQTITELDEKYSKGTLRDKDVMVAVGSMALDLLPVVGRSSRMLTLGRKAFFVIEGVQWGGQAVLVSSQAFDEIDALRNGVMSRLAKNLEEYQRRYNDNQADPQLAVLKAEQEKLIAEARSATTDVFSKLILRHAVMTVGGAITQEMARSAFSKRIKLMEERGRLAHVDGEQARFDYDQKKVVGDTKKMTPIELERVERHMDLSDKLEKAVPDPGQRRAIVEQIGDAEVEIRTGAKKTRLEVEGDKKVLHIAEKATPTEIASEAYRLKTGTAVPEGGMGNTPVEKAAYHQNELTHLEDLRNRAQAGTKGLDDFEIDTKIRNQFLELEKTVQKMPAGTKGREELAAWVEKYRKQTYEPAAALNDRLRAAHSGLPETYQKLNAEQRRQVRAMADEGLAAFSRLSPAKRQAFLSLPEHAIDTFNRNSGPRQAELLRDVESLTRGARLDVDYIKTDDHGVAHTREGHPFEKHGPHVSDADLFARAKAENSPISRWKSVADMEAEIAARRRTMLDPNTPPGSDHSAINADGRDAIARSRRPVGPRQPPRTPLSAADILADPVRYRRYLKEKVEFKEVRSLGGKVVGEEFHPDGVTRRPVDTVTVVFEIDDAGAYHTLTGFPEKP